MSYADVFHSFGKLVRLLNFYLFVQQLIHEPCLCGLKITLHTTTKFKQVNTFFTVSSKVGQFP